MSFTGQARDTNISLIRGWNLISVSIDTLLPELKRQATLEGIVWEFAATALLTSPDSAKYSNARRSLDTDSAC